MRRSFKVWLHRRRPVLLLAAVVGVSGLYPFSQELCPVQRVGEIVWRAAPKEQGPQPMEYGNGPRPRWLVDGAMVEAGPRPQGPYDSDHDYQIDKAKGEYYDAVLLRLSKLPPEQQAAAARAAMLPEDRLRFDATEHYATMPNVPYPVFSTPRQVRAVQVVPVCRPTYVPTAYAVPSYSPFYSVGDEYRRRAVIQQRPQGLLSGGLRGLAGYR